MKKNDIIEQLNAIDGNHEVCIYDYKRNQHEDSGDDEGCSAGIYPKFEIELMGKADIPNGSQPWIGIGFDNPYFPEEGDRSDTFTELAHEFLAFSLPTFKKATAFSSIDKLREELREVESAVENNAENKSEEFADCLMCLLDSAARSGVFPADLMLAFSEKLKVNKNREWVKNADNTYSHK